MTDEFAVGECEGCKKRFKVNLTEGGDIDWKQTDVNYSFHEMCEHPGKSYEWNVVIECVCGSCNQQKLWHDTNEEYFCPFC